MNEADFRGIFVGCYVLYLAGIAYISFEYTVEFMALFTAEFAYQIAGAAFIVGYMIFCSVVIFITCMELSKLNESAAKNGR